MFPFFSTVSIALIRAIANEKTRLYAIVAELQGKVFATIVYDKLWETMKLRNISQYKLIQTYHISNGQLDRLRKNGNISSYTMNRLCQILHCRLEDIAEYREEE